MQKKKLNKNPKNSPGRFFLTTAFPEKLNLQTMFNVLLNPIHHNQLQG